MASQILVDLDLIDFNNVIADVEVIRRYNPQRFEMEQITAVVYEDLEEMICVGYKDITHEEFWVKGHMPGMPLMPGVIMIEASAQLASYFAQKTDALGASMLGFGGLERVRFRDPVIPGDRLILITKFLKARRGRMVVAAFQGVVGNSLVVEGELKGIPIPVDALSQSANEAIAD